MIGSPGHAVLPGFVNAHYHSECNLVQGVYDTIFELANLWVHGLLGEIDEDDLYDVLMVGLIDTVRGGQTCVVDAYYGRRGLPNFSADVALQAYWDLGTRVGFGLSFRDRNRYTHEGDDRFLSRLPADVADEIRASDMGYAWPVDDVEKAYRRLVADWDGRGGRIRVLAAPDWTPAVSDELYLRCRALADEFGTGLTTHCLETRSEMAFSMAHHGTTAVRRLADLGILGPDVSLAHFVWPTDEDIAIVADAGAVVASNPGSNLRLSSGICRTRDMLDAGVRVGVGTDGISATEREDYLAELRLSAYLQRVPRALESGRVNGPDYLAAPPRAGRRPPGWETASARWSRAGPPTGAPPGAGVLAAQPLRRGRPDRRDPRSRRPVGHRVGDGPGAPDPRCGRHRHDRRDRDPGAPRRGVRRAGPPPQRTAPARRRGAAGPGDAPRARLLPDVVGSPGPHGLRLQRGTGAIARWMTRFGSRARRCAPHRQTEGDP